MNLSIPEGVNVTVEGKKITVSKGKITLTREFDFPKFRVEQKDSELILKMLKGTNRDQTILKSFEKHIENMFLGLDKAFTYKLKVCSSHFPMSVAVKGDHFEVKNFFGERVPRTLTVPADVNVKVNGDVIEVSSHYIEKAGNFASNIERLTRRPGYDSRIFQDGIYITSKKE